MAHEQSFPKKKTQPSKRLWEPRSSSPWRPRGPLSSGPASGWPRPTGPSRRAAAPSRGWGRGSRGSGGKTEKKRLTISFQNSHPPLCPPLLENSTATLLTPPASSPSPPFSLFRPPPGARRLDPAGPPAPARDDSPRLRRAARRRRLDRGRAPHFGRDVPAGRGQQDDRVGRGGRAGAVRAGYPVGEDQALR